MRRHLAEHPGQPLFNYLLTIFGHTPHNEDLDKRPRIIKVETPHNDEHLERVVNHFYYRTEALAAYVRELIALDPDSLILLVSDHVPPLQFGPPTYKALGYMGNIEGSHFYNRIAILDRGRPVPYPPLRHFDFPDLIVDTLTGGRYCATAECDYLSTTKPPREDYADQYLALMAHASE